MAEMHLRFAMLHGKANELEMFPTRISLYVHVCRHASMCLCQYWAAFFALGFTRQWRTRWDTLRFVESLSAELANMMQFAFTLRICSLPWPGTCSGGVRTRRQSDAPSLSWP